MRIYLWILLLAGTPALMHAQISGQVQGYDGDTLISLAGANVYWEGTQIGTITDADGKFIIDRTPGANTLVASFIGYETQSKIIISRSGTTNFILPPSGSKLTEIEIIGRIEASSIDLNAADLSYRITSKELRKAACCNLSESFETNASVDVSFTDPVSGQKQIEMLGQAGRYALIQRENIPFARGLNANSGLAFIPGPFVENLQLTKGLSSVLNGYESITGQINVEFYKPESSPALLLNLFGNQGARMEGNLVTRFNAGSDLESAIMAHYSMRPIAMDRNSDGFADMPTGDQFNLLNRWHWKSPESGWEGQIGLSAIRDNKQGGQLASLNNNEDPDSLWQFNSDATRIELFGKNGYLFGDNDFHSLGIIYTLTDDRRNAAYGDYDYAGRQQSFYLNTIYQDIIGDTRHKFRTGLSFQADFVSEDLSLSDQDWYLQERTELVPGAYAEYTFEPSKDLTLVSGARIDYNSYFSQLLFTPRINLRYQFTEFTTLRLGFGRGQRTPNLIAENFNVLATGRSLIVSEWRGPEIAWNTGVSLVQQLDLGMEKASVSIDGFYTWFSSKQVTDLDFNRTATYLINGEGSRSFSVLTQLDLSPVKWMNLRLAYKYLDAMDAFMNGLDYSYHIPKNRAFVNLALESDNRWKFDLTVNWFGKRRLPESDGAPADYIRADWSPDFFTMNTQINKGFDNGLELFVGVDNLLDFRQLDPIVAADAPASPYFDVNYAWGPIFGRNIYAGLYLTLDRKK